MASKAKSSRKAKPKARRKSARTAQRSGPSKTALVRTSQRDEAAAKSGVSSKRHTATRSTDSSADSARDFPNAIYEDDSRS